MKIEVHNVDGVSIAEIIPEGVIISTIGDATDLIGNLYYQDADSLIIYEQSITAAFFDLRNQLAGNVLQKFANYRLRLAIVGDFSKYPGKSLRDFIRESNKGRQVNFVSSRQEAISALSGRPK